MLAETFLAAGKLLALLRVVRGNLVIHTDRMRANLDATRGFVFSEAVMLALAARIGKQSAHTLVYETAMNAQATCGLPDGNACSQAESKVVLPKLISFFANRFLVFTPQSIRRLY